MRLARVLERLDSHTETGLYYYRARYYDQSVGRFLTEDPIGFDEGLNFYAYTENTPTNWIDPFGLYHCVGNANCNFTPPMASALHCFDNCIAKALGLPAFDTVITGGVGKRSKPGSSHSKGEAADIGRNCNPSLTPNNVKPCFSKCFPNGYGQEENNDPSIGGTHFHFQLNTVPWGQPRFAPGIQPYAP